MSLYRPSVDDVIYSWVIDPFDHIVEDCFLSPEAQFSALNDGFWQLVLYPKKVENEREYVQLGLRNVPVHTGPQDTTVRFRFELEARGSTLDTPLGPRRGEYPKDNNVGYNVICRELLFQGIRSTDPIKLLIKCFIKNLRREKHCRNLTLNATTDIVKQQVVEMVEVGRKSKNFDKQIAVGKAQRQDAFEPLSVAEIRITTDSNREWFKVALVSSNSCHPSAINCCLSLLDKRGQVFKKTEKQTHFFRVDHDEWELPQLISKQDLDNKDNNLLDDKGQFILRFDMEISVGEYNHHQDKAPTGRLHLPDCGITLAEELGKAFESEKYSDLTIVVDEEHANPDQKPIRVHKCILASRSSYFKAMLEGNMKEKYSEQICLSEVAYSTLELVIRFLYTDDVDFVDKDTGSDMDYQEVMAIYKAADMYNVATLREDCSFFLQKHISKENALTLQKFVSHYVDEPLTKAIDEFISKSGSDLLQFLESPQESVESPQEEAPQEPPQEEAPQEPVEPPQEEAPQEPVEPPREPVRRSQRNIRNRRMNQS